MSDVSGPNYQPPTEEDEPTLRRGDGSADGWVEYLQHLLASRRVAVLAINGEFGEETYEAVRRFQADNGLSVDGIVGNQTWAALQKEGDRLPGTDGRPPHSFAEQGEEARWLVHEEPAVYDPEWDLVFLDAVNTGSVTIMAEEYTPVVRITGSHHGPVTGYMHVLDGEPAIPPGERFRFALGHLRELLGAGTYSIDAYLPSVLGGDEINSTFTIDY